MKTKLIFVAVILVVAVGVAVYFFRSGAGAPAAGAAQSATEPHRAANAAAKPPGEGHKTEIVRLSEEALREFGVETAVAGPGQLRREVQLPGEVKLNEVRVGHIVPRFGGIVKEIRHQLGDVVQAGEVMARVESNESLQSYDLKSLIGGTVIQQHITLGEMLEGNTEAFIVADLSSVWVDFSIYQKDIGLVQPGQQVTIIAPHGLGTATAKIAYLGPSMNEATRTALARVVLPAPDRNWLPGMFVTGRLVIDVKERPLVIPLTAVQAIEDRESVFVNTKDGFVPRAVRLGQKDSTSAEVLDGLSPGETFAAKGAFTLKAELLKGTLGDEH
ncbi:MAG: efflux RND transporter periplasmic adaptor subunit [Opitutaceae bacterium]|nr:efflux RND transporter periplasmic adaptor subunit [Opitutaceae bacterium]